MIFKSLTYLSSVCLQLFLLALLTFDVNAQSEKEKDLPNSGSLSKSVISAKKSGESVDGPWGGIDAQGATNAPISGSVSKVGKDNWRMRVFNNAGEVYSVTVAVTQFNQRGTQVKRDSYSYTLKPGQTEERDVAALATTAQCSLDLISWKKLGTKK